MKKIKSMILIIIFSLIFVFSQSRGFRVVTTEGETIKLYESSYALLIGVSDYISGWPDLPGVINDIKEVEQALEKHGFTVSVLENPNSSDLVTGFKNFINSYGLDTENRLLFYYAGHGHTEKLAYGGEMGYIVPGDAPIPDKDKKGFFSIAIDMQQFDTFAKKIQSKHAMFVFDSCFSGSIFALSRAIPEIISYKTAKPVRQFITSGSMDEIVPDKSVFKMQFIDGINGEADKNHDGYITGSELGEFLQTKVVNYSHGSQHPQYGKIRNPYLDKGDFVFKVPDKSQAISVVSQYKPNLPAAAQDIDISKLEAEAEINRLAKEQEKNAWSDWQAKFQENVTQLKKIDIDNNISAQSKKNAWEKLLSNYDQDNPYSIEDEELKTYAIERVKYWKNETKRQSTASHQVTKPSIQPSTFTGPRLRSSYMSLSVGDVKSMFSRKGFFDKHWNESGSFINNYQSRTINGDKVVIDRATGLMWHQAGSLRSMKYEAARQWVQDLNNRGYAGYHDWRLPTLEEGASLLESNKMNGALYINPVFSIWQGYIWTGDKTGSGAAWVVFFLFGNVHYRSLNYDYFVRPVRPGQSTINQQVIKPSVQPTSITSVRLRSSYTSLSKADVGSMLKNKGFFSKQSSWNFEYCNPDGDFKNQYEAKTINGDKVVVQHATGLMWHQSGSSEYMNYEKAEQWIRDLNNREYAGYNDWRLPTLEEGASLLENIEHWDLYIDPVFSDRQHCIWTGDKYGSGAAWVVHFFFGEVILNIDLSFKVWVRPVRPGQSSTFSGIRLRSSYRSLSDNEVGTMLKNKGFFSKQFSWNPKFCNPEGDFKNQYESKIINGDKVVIDHATGLMWHQSGSSKYMKYKKVGKWIRDLNNRGYAGYNDWRLPTLEEGASLLENSKQNGDLYIDPVFSDRQTEIWIGDKYEDWAAWVVDFDFGGVPPRHLITCNKYVRPVRPGQ